ncbi:acyl-CoA-6-aminopenicillanic acid acyltransferase [Rhizobium leguminosarum]|uniref:C45 family autoproteolytic acyltransferase/hydolase n=1 Tax=Rhizobium leguminosarum TaxID=384 RepID=UPI001C945F6C|nr:C45 family peptidase [Rhizobium leguminosarum]MBY5324279.1 acyl-CoA-6-aminopenicillanic acid acyltransferase [Rhizobium leguminosarum]
MNPEMPIVVLVGTAYERGIAHGSRFKRQISDILDRDLGQLTAADLAVVRMRASDGFERIRSFAPQVADEIKGIADGMGRDVQDLVLRSGFELFKPMDDTGCSALSAKTQSGAIAAQNWDGLPSKHGDLALFLHFAPDGFQFAVVDSFGSLGAAGMNRHGLGLVNTDLLLSGTKAGIPSRVVRRLILEMPDVRSAAQRIRELPHMGGRAYLLADRKGDVTAVEVSARSGANFLPAADVYVHTNNTVLPATREEEDTEALSRVYPSSTARLSALGSALKREKISVDGVKQMLRDETGAPDSVCKTSSTSEPTETAFSIVMDCSRGEMHLSAGRPTMNAYRTISLPAV